MQKHIVINQANSLSFSLRSARDTSWSTVICQLPLKQRHLRVVEHSLASFCSLFVNYLLSEVSASAQVSCLESWTEVCGTRLRTSAKTDSYSNRSLARQTKFANIPRKRTTISLVFLLLAFFFCLLMLRLCSE